MTSRDVAARARVSQPTVSLVLSENPRARVADSTRARVHEAARALGYQPNLIARGLVSRRSYALGVIVRNLENPLLTEVISGAERVATEEGYALLVCDARRTPAEAHLRALRSRLVDGVVLDAESARALPKSAHDDVNMVVVDASGGRSPGIASDARAAGRMAACHLLDLGHRHFAFLGPESDTHPFRMRERGFVEALRAASVDLASEALRRVPATVAGGREGLSAVLALDRRPTACFCANDLLAIGALNAARSRGVRVPEDLSVVGCDDIEMSRVVSPVLTTVRIPARQMGARAARALIRTIESGAEDAAGVIPSRPLPVKLIVRESTGPAPGRHP